MTDSAVDPVTDPTSDHLIAPTDESAEPTGKTVDDTAHETGPNIAASDPVGETDAAGVDSAVDSAVGVAPGADAETNEESVDTHDAVREESVIDPADPPVEVGVREPVLSPPVLTLAQAVQVTGRSKNTIKARKDKLIEAGTTIDASGWSIPYPALIQVGLLDSVSAAEAPAPTSTGISSANDGIKSGVNGGVKDQNDPGHGVKDEELARLREQVSDLRHRVALAEAIAAERDRVIDVQNRALRMLEVGTAPATAEVDRKPAQPPAPIKKRRWFSRG